MPSFFNRLLNQIRALRPLSIPHREEPEEEVFPPARVLEIPEIPLPEPPPEPLPQPPERMAAPTVSPIDGSYTTLDVTWVAPFSEDGIEAYQLEFRVDGETDYTRIDLPSTSLSYVLGSVAEVLTEDTLYFVRMRAQSTNLLWAIEWSPEGSARTNKEPEPPEPPIIESIGADSNLLTPGGDTNVSVVARDPDGDDSTLTYSWSANGGSFPDGDDSATVMWLDASDVNITASVEFELTVTVTDVTTLSVTSSPVIITVQPFPPPERMEVPTVTPIDNSYTTLDVTWTAPNSANGIQAYQLEFRVDGEMDWVTIDLPSPPLSYVLGSGTEVLTQDTLYFVRMRAQNDAGFWALLWSPEGSERTNREPQPPIIESIGATDNLLMPGDDTNVFVVATDPDGDDATLTYLWSANGGSFPDGNTAATVRWLDASDVSITEPIEFELTVTVTDTTVPIGLSVTSSPLVITVQPTPPPERMAAPVVEPIDGSYTTLDVTWVAPVSENDIQAYELEFRADGETDYIRIDLPSTPLSYVLGSGTEVLTADTLYFVRMRAEDEDGLLALEWSPEGSGRTNKIPLPPVIESISVVDNLLTPGDDTNVSVVARDPDGDDALLTYSWSANGGSFPDGDDAATVRWLDASDVNITASVEFEVSVTVTDSTVPTGLSVTSSPVVITVEPFPPPERMEAPDVAPIDNSYTTLQINWMAPTSANGIQAYQLEFRPDGETNYTRLDLPAMTAEYILGSGDEVLTADTLYFVRMSAQNNAGFWALQWSPEGSERTNKVPLPPVIDSIGAVDNLLMPGEDTNVFVVATDPDGDDALLTYSWSANGGSFPDGDDSATVRWLDASDVNITESVEFELTVTVTDVTILSVTSSPVVITVEPFPPPEQMEAPDVTPIDDSYTTLQINWMAPNSVNGIQAYQLEFRPDGETDYTRISLPAMTAEYILGSGSEILTQGTLYYVRMRAQNDAGFWALQWSPEGSGTTNEEPEPMLPPVIEEIGSDDAVLNAGGQTRVFVVARDPDGLDERLTYNWVSTGDSVPVGDRFPDGNDTTEVMWVAPSGSVLESVDYTIFVTVTDEDGLSVQSDDITITIDPFPPPQTMEAPDVAPIDDSYTTLQINWMAPTSANGIKAYQLEFRPDGETTYTRISLPAMTAEYILGSGDEVLTQDTLYYVRMRAQNNDDLWALQFSPEGSERTNEQPVAPEAPAAPTVTTLSTNHTSLVVVWTAPNDNGFVITDYDVQYRLYESSDTFTPHDFTGPDLSTTITGLTEDMQYEIQVRAENEGGESDWSENGVGITVLAPDAPDAPTVTQGDDHTELDVEWEEPFNGGADIEAYYLEYKKTDDLTYIERRFTVDSIDITVDDTTDPTTIATTITGLDENTQYDVRVSAESLAVDEMFRRSGPSDVTQQSTSILNRPPTINSFVAFPRNITVKETSTITCVAEDPESDTITFTYTFVDSEGMELADQSEEVVGQFIEISNEMLAGVMTNIQSYLPPNIRGTYYIKVVASDRDRSAETLMSLMNPSAQVTINVECERPESPDPPTVIAPPNTSGELRVRWVEPESNGCPIINYQVQFVPIPPVPAGASLSAVTRRTAGVETSFLLIFLLLGQRYNVRVRAGNRINGVFGYGDWSDYTEGTTGYINHAPIITSFTADPESIDVTERSRLTVNAFDPDGDPIIYSFSVMDGHGTFGVDPDSLESDLLEPNQQIYHPPEEPGTYTITVTATDDPDNNPSPFIPDGVTPLSDSDSIMIEVTERPCDPPGQVTGVTVETLSTSELRLVWAPPENDGGSPITDYQIEYVTNVDPDDMQPVFESGGISVGTSLIYTDPEPTLSGLQTYIEVDGLAEATRYYFRVRAGNDCDDDGTNEYGDWSLPGAGNTNNVGPTCDLQPSGTIIVNKGTETTFTVTPSDDVVTIVWSQEGGEFDSTFDPSQERIPTQVWIAPLISGLYSVQTVVSDAGNPPDDPTPLSATCVTNIIVINRPPVIHTISDDVERVCIGSRVDLMVIANDPDIGDTANLTFGWEYDEGSGMVSDPYDVDIGGVRYRRSDFEWFAPATPGDHTITAVVSDVVSNEQDLAVTQLRHSIIVTVNHPPTVSIEADATELDRDTTTVIRATIADQDDDLTDLTITWNSTLGSFEGDVTMDAMGRYIRTWRAPNFRDTSDITVSVDDGCGVVVSDPVSITTRNTAPMPNIVPESAFIVPGNIQEFIVHPNDADGDPCTYFWEITEGGGRLIDSNDTELDPDSTDHPQVIFFVAPNIPDSPVIQSVEGVEGNPEHLVVTWLTPESNGSAITDYNIRYRLSSSSGSPVNEYVEYEPNAASSTDTTITMMGLMPGRLYDIQVRAINGIGHSSWSAAFQGMTSNAPPVVVSFTTDDTNITSMQTATISVVATDAENDPISYTFSFPDAPAMQHDAHGLLVAADSLAGNERKYIPPQTAGTYRIQVVVDDGIERPDLTTTTHIADLSIVVTLQPNRAPIIHYADFRNNLTAGHNQFDRQSVPRNQHSGSSMDITVLASDPDGDTLVYSFSNPRYGTLQAHPSGRSNQRRYIPPRRSPFQTGFTSGVGIMITVSDGELSATASVSFNLGSIDFSPLSPTVLKVTGLASNIYNPNSESSSGTLYLRWRPSSSYGLPIENFIVESKAELSNVWGGRRFHSGTARVSSRSGTIFTSRSLDFRINMTTSSGTSFHSMASGRLAQGVRLNTEPVINSITADPTSISVNEFTTITVDATDGENDYLFYTFTSTDGYLLKVRGRRHEEIFVAPDTPGTYTINVTVSDGLLSDSTSIDIIVTDSDDDITAPDRPAAPNVTQHDDFRRLNVSWTAPMDNGTSILDYDLRYKRSADSIWSSWEFSGDGTEAIIGTNTTPLMPNTRYDVQVRAYNGQESDWSPSGQATTAMGQVVTTPDRMAAPTLTRHSSPTRMNVSFMAPSNDGGSTILDYQNPL